MNIDRESMQFDVLIVGAGIAGLSTAVKLKQLAMKNNFEIEICVIEKSSEIGGHIVSGAVFEPSTLSELIPNWESLDSPVKTKVKSDDVSFLKNSSKSIKIPNWAIPKTMHNDGNYIISLSNFTKWLGDYAENLGVNIFPGFSGSEIIYSADGVVKGVATGDMGVSISREKKSGYARGMALLAKYTVFSEGCRGNLGKQIISRFDLDKGKNPQHYAIGIKEVWELPETSDKEGLVIHTAGWPLSESKSTGGGFLYHFDKNLISVGLIVDLAYKNPNLSPFLEMQRYKTHPKIKKYLTGAKRISYGARSICKGGIQSLPKMSFKGGLLIGDDAGTLNFAKIKGSHTAMKSGMIAADVLYLAVTSGEDGTDLVSYSNYFMNSSIHKELKLQRNFGPAQHKWGNLLGSAYSFFDINICNGKLPWTLSDEIADFARMEKISKSKQIDYPKPDGEITFDIPSSIFLSSIYHEEDQPIHLKLNNSVNIIESNLDDYNEPAQLYCPAGVYEIINSKKGEKLLQINSQNCLHCKTCDIKDPAQSITWVVPEGGSGPNYSNM